MTQKTDIIAAIATPRGKGAISCIRLSGEGSVALLSKLTGKPIDAFEHGKTVKCAFFAKVRDTIVAVAYLNGKSFTGEESAELFFHGGKFLTEQALYGILENGARLAEAGEFTRRAFLNGKIDLTQAEGIADLIDADSGDAAAQAYEQSEGKTAQAIDELYKAAVTAAARAEVCIDYPEEDIEEQTREDLIDELRRLLERIEKEKSGYDGGRIKREGARVAITGRTNAGKSTLFNTLLREDRAIVSDEEGTTRDTIEEKISIQGSAFVLIDTAGMRETENKVEKMGIERSKAAVQKAEIVLRVVRKGENIDESVDANEMIVINSFQSLTATERAQKNGITVNAATGEGTDALTEALYERAKQLTSGGGNINNARQFAALDEAAECLRRAQTAANELTMDCVCADLHGAVAALGKITGKNASESVIDEIFSKFCVGK